MIDTNNFKYKDSIWQDIFVHLKNANFEVYPPGIKKGECESSYVVVKNDGSTKHASFSTDVDLYAIMCYVPKDEYSTLESFVQNVKESMKGLMPVVLPYGSQTPSYYDDGVKAHMISVEYKNYKKL